jgi:hypothetical protein
MVQLVDSDIKTREVLDWKGVHVLHFAGSSCSQKLRIFLNLKGIPWSRIPSICWQRNFRPWFLGINPRGLVPVLCTTARCISRATTSSSIWKTIPGAEAHSSRPRERGRGAAQARGRSASRPPHLELPVRVRAARPPKSTAALASYAAKPGTVQGARDRDKEIPDRVLAARRQGRL